MLQDEVDYTIKSNCSSDNREKRSLDFDTNVVVVQQEGQVWFIRYSSNQNLDYHHPLDINYRYTL